MFDPPKQAQRIGDEAMTTGTATGAVAFLLKREVLHALEEITRISGPFGLPSREVARAALAAMDGK